MANILHCFFVGLIALSLFGAVFAVPTSAQQVQLVAILESPYPQPDAEFGWSVACSGDLVVVGERLADIEQRSNEGRAYIYDSDGNLLHTLTAPEPQAEALFGCSVAISGDVVVVGECYYDGQNDQQGRAHIFDSDGNFIVTIYSPDPQYSADFGYSVAVSGNVVVVGEQNANVNDNSGEGRAHIFDSSGNYLYTLSAPEYQDSAHFGKSVAVSGDVVVVGEPEADVAFTSEEGRAYIFDSSGNYEHTLLAPVPQDSAYFGTSVAVCGDVVVVGEPEANLIPDSDEGRAYIFDSDGNLMRTLTAQEPQEYGIFGSAVAVGEEFIVVGEPAQYDLTIGQERAHVFDTAGNLISILTPPPSPEEETHYGSSVATSGNMVVVGEYSADVVFDSDEGRVYIYKYISAVGGEIIPINGLAIMTPWITIVMIALTISAIMLVRRKLFL